MPSEAKKLPVVFIGLPVYGGMVLAENAANVEFLTRQMEAHKWGVYTYRASMSDVVDTRNCMLTYWYDAHPESEYFLTIDNDMIFDWQMVIKMFMIDKPVVGVIYSKKHIAEPGKDGKVNFWDITVGEPLPNNQPIVDGFQQWKYVGAGVLLIKREAVTKILENFPEINDLTDPGFLVKTHVSRVIGAFDKIVTPEGRHLSEDISFCHRWRECGGEIWAAVDWTIGHRGLFTYNFQARSMLGLDGEVAGLPVPDKKNYLPSRDDDLHDAREMEWLRKQIAGAHSLLEIGSAAGNSLRAMAQSLAPGAKIRAIDLGTFPDQAGQYSGVDCKEALLDTVKYLRRKGFDVEVFFGDSHSEEAAKWAREQAPEGYNVVFIDGDHTLSGVRDDYETYGRMGRIVALHDVANEGTDVPLFWEELTARGFIGEAFVATKPGMGIGLLHVHNDVLAAA